MVKRISHKIYVVSATHWDREWRFPFQKTRMMLVDMIDHLLDILETCPDYACFDNMSAAAHIIKRLLTRSHPQKELLP